MQAQKLGFKRVVLSRELSLDEISHICHHSQIEIETFIHGALCISYSGQCCWCHVFSTSIDGSAFHVSSYRIDLLEETVEEANQIIETVLTEKRLEGKEYTNGNLNRKI